MPGKKLIATAVTIIILSLLITGGNALWGLHESLEPAAGGVYLNGITWMAGLIGAILVGCGLALLLSLDKAGKLAHLIRCLREESTHSAHQRAQLEQFFAISPDILCTLDQEGGFLQVNPAAGDILSRRPEDMAGTPFLSIICDQDRPDVVKRITQLLSGEHPQVTFDARTRTADGDHRWVEWSFVKVDWETLYFGYGRDIHDRKVMEKQLQHSAFHDKLTGVANRELFLDRLDQAIHRSRRRPAPYAVLLMDIDNFKTINDSYGHQVGDSLLKLFSQRIEEQLRPEDTLARFGGDEFILLAEQVADYEAAASLASRILDSLRQPFTVDGVDFEVGSSLGVTVESGTERSADSLIRKADLSLYKAKEGGKGSYFIFDQVLNNEQRTRARLETELRKALQNQGLKAHFQTIIDVATGQPSGCEVLCRWHHEELGAMNPEEFIPVAEASGLVADIGRQMLTQACAALQQWRDNGAVPCEFAISVNLSPREFFQVDLVPFIQQTLQAYGLNGRHLNLEVTEGVLIERDGEASVILNRLRELGISIYVDDFGTGYSSLSYLRTLPVDGIKLDKSFMEKIDSARKSQEIARTVLELAKVLKLRSIVEGIETPEQLAFVTDVGFGYAQGYGLHRPCDKDTFALWMATQATAA
ncbi:putative bifunctional diguanylate cyclase/phosphodiesterase [Marinimicrobium sp. C2-29]|uniref:putative bifunctional diguanylate cyclase/phosphodiesterase n=1 Tax=Marinimicrobium sp. C2-29 TaxID=3139825 RepID=UPI00313A17D6